MRALSAEALPPTTVTQGEQSVVVTTTRYATEATLLLSPTLGIPLSQVATTTSAQTVGPPGAGGTPGGSLVETNRTVEATLTAHEPSAATTAPGPPASPPAATAPPRAPGG